MRDQLGDHRVVEHRDLVALADTRIDANSPLVQLAFGGEAHALQAADAGEESTIRVFGVDA